MAPAHLVPTQTNFSARARDTLHSTTTSAMAKLSYIMISLHNKYCVHWDRTVQTSPMPAYRAVTQERSP